MSPHPLRGADAVVGKGAPLPTPAGRRALVGQARLQSLEPRPLVSRRGDPQARQPTHGILWNLCELGEIGGGGQGKWVRTELGGGGLAPGALRWAALSTPHQGRATAPSAGAPRQPLLRVAHCPPHGSGPACTQSQVDPPGTGPCLPSPGRVDFAQHGSEAKCTPGRGQRREVGDTKGVPRCDHWASAGRGSPCPALVSPGGSTGHGACGHLLFCSLEALVSGSQRVNSAPLGQWACWGPAHLSLRLGEAVRSGAGRAEADTGERLWVGAGSLPVHSGRAHPCCTSRLAHLSQSAPVPTALTGWIRWTGSQAPGAGRGLGSGAGHLVSTSRQALGHPTPPRGIGLGGGPWGQGSAWLLAAGPQTLSWHPACLGRVGWVRAAWRPRWGCAGLRGALSPGSAARTQFGRDGVALTSPALGFS